LPANPPKIAGLDLDGKNLPCHGVGGDYYDYFPYPDGRIGIVVADVAGKGMPAAMMMSNMQAHMQVYTETFREPAEVALRKYFIAGDVHFTELGHRLLFDEVKRVESLPGPEVQSSRNPHPGSTP